MSLRRISIVGLVHSPLKAETVGSNPLCATNYWGCMLCVFLIWVVGTAMLPGSVISISMERCPNWKGARLLPV